MQPNRLTIVRLPPDYTTPSISSYSIPHLYTCVTNGSANQSVCGKCVDRSTPRHGLMRDQFPSCISSGQQVYSPSFSGAKLCCQGATSAQFGNSSSAPTSWDVIWVNVVLGSADRECRSYAFAVSRSCSHSSSALFLARVFLTRRFPERTGFTLFDSSSAGGS